MQRITPSTKLHFISLYHIALRKQFVVFFLKLIKLQKKLAARNIIVRNASLAENCDKKQH